MLSNKIKYEVYVALILRDEQKQDRWLGAVVTLHPYLHDTERQSFPIAEHQFLPC